APSAAPAPEAGSATTEGADPPSPGSAAAADAGLEQALQKQASEIERLTTELELARRDAAPGAPPPLEGGASPAAPATPIEYRIGAGDILEVSVWKNPEVSRTVSVEPSGTISLPLLNQVPAAGLTPEQLRANLAQRFSEYIPAPQVSVLVSGVHSYTISVIGQAGKPGSYELQRPTTVLEALALAGGFTAFASTRKVFVLRKEPDGTKRIPFSYKEATSEEAAEANFYLQPGDILVIP
ncbi:MAG: polysaccharide biosynthesis/export family protein, partial [Candidatus Binatia bacterium]